MKLHELITAVKEQSLTKDQLENYRDQMSHLYAEMQIELAEIEKEKALFFQAVKRGSPSLSDIAIKRNWQSHKEGLREITLKRYCLATKELLNSLRSRLYQVY